MISQRRCIERCKREIDIWKGSRTSLGLPHKVKERMGLNQKRHGPSYKSRMMNTKQWPLDLDSNDQDNGRFNFNRGGNRNHL